MSIPRGYVPNHKMWDQIGRVTPNVEYCESDRPHIEMTPAAWLPVSRYDRELEYYIVVSAGKVVAQDREGKAVPAGLRKAWNALIGSGSAAITYTATDVAQSVIDITTGKLLTGAVSYTEAQITAALKERGLIRATEKAMDFISKPIGIASYNYYKAAGTDHYNPKNLFQHNFRPQALVAVTCDYVATYPVLPAVVTAEEQAGAIASSIDWTSARTKGWFNAAAINGLVKYSNEVAATDDVVAYVFENFPLAHITSESPITTSATNGLVNMVSSVGAINAAGDYFIDYDLGILFVYSVNDQIPSPWSVSTTITYYHYQAEGTATNTVSTYACATGDLEYGDFLTYDKNSNLVKATLDLYNAEGYDASLAKYGADPDYSATDADISLQLEQGISGYMTGIVGQVIGTTVYPKDLLDRVKTSYEGQSAANMRTPGSATGGRSDQLTYSNAAEKLVVVNLILR
jgi:hypothetical protein